MGGATAFAARREPTTPHGRARAARSSRPPPMPTDNGPSCDPGRRHRLRETTPLGTPNAQRIATSLDNRMKREPRIGSVSHPYNRRSALPELSHTARLRQAGDHGKSAVRRRSPDRPRLAVERALRAASRRRGRRRRGRRGRTCRVWSRRVGDRADGKRPRSGRPRRASRWP